MTTNQAQFPYVMTTTAWHESPSDSRASRYGDYALMPRYEASMPHRCIRCNGPASGERLHKNVYWHHPAWYLLLLGRMGGMILYVIIALIVRKKASIEYSLCENHYRRRKLGMALGIGCLLGMFVLAGAGIGLELPLLVAMSPLFGLVAIAGPFIMRMVTVSKIDDSYAYYNVGESFLQSLPPPPQYWRR